MENPVIMALTHWGRVTHICVSKLTIIGPDNGLSPGRRQSIIWTNAGILLIRNFGTNFSEILIESLTFCFKKMHLKMSSTKWQQFCLGLNVLTWSPLAKLKVIIMTASGAASDKQVTSMKIFGFQWCTPAKLQSATSNILIPFQPLHIWNVYRDMMVMHQVTFCQGNGSLFTQHQAITCINATNFQ